MDNAHFLKNMIDFSFQLKRAFSLYIEREIDLTYPQWRVIKAVRFSEGGISAAQIAATLGFDKVTISDIVNRLIRKGYLTKEVDTSDRRRNLLGLSEQSHLLCKNVMGIEANFNQCLFADISDADANNYNDTTNKLMNKLNEMNRSEK